MKLPKLVLFLAVAAGALGAGEAVAQAGPEANRIQEQAATVLAQARRCSQLIDKASIDRFAGRATAVIFRADGQPVARGRSGDYEMVSATLTMAADCKNIQCPGKGPPLLPPNCAEFARTFQSLRINQSNWQLNEGLN
jgi:hypothetical protein